ncbi:MAG TPA: NAD(P)H-quinone oxidoreductase [Caulobacteraceae bacterium]|nr:NAD(P)H-quinone oxidoreductase [Caulobacteraceae bacterium]
MADRAKLMRAVVIEGGRGDARALHVAQVEQPRPQSGEILISARAAGVNRPDILQRQGLYPPPPGAPATLGLEVAGEVTRAAGRWREGDRVCALLGGGGYAEYVACDPRHALPIPDPLDFAAAAGLPETVFTVFANVFEHGALRPGETLLAHGANSGIGVMAIQMAKAAGARVIATARGAEKTRRARELGADLAIDTSVDDFQSEARAFGGADVILDMVGGDFFAANLEALNVGGRLVQIAAQAGGTVQLPIFKLMQKRLVVTGSTLRPRSADEKARLASEVERRVWPWIESGAVRPIIARTFPLEAAADAHAFLESGQAFGKVVLTV